MVRIGLHEIAQQMQYRMRFRTQPSMAFFGLPNFHPLENLHTCFVNPEKKICIFDPFQQLTTSVPCMMLMQGTHEPAADNAGHHGKESGCG